MNNIFHAKTLNMQIIVSDHKLIKLVINNVQINK